MDKNQRRAQALGMPWGTASNKLRKNVLFSILARHNENICFKCGEPIDCSEDLSMEHKEPWEGRDVELFWDVDNIAFSHRRCNLPHVQRNGYSYISDLTPAGYIWCSLHKDYVSVEKFWKNSAQKSGYATQCKDHP